MKKLFISSLIACSKVFAQLPETELFLADVDIKNKVLKVKSAEKISDHKGYNNQPCFINNNKEILFTSDVELNNKTHICDYSLKSKKIKRLSITNTSEYSANVLPNKKDFSVVMVEKDSTQRIWVFDLEKGANMDCLSQQTDSVGYYAWLGKDSILYYKLTNPHSLHALNIKTNEDVWLCNNPTRSFKQINSTTFFYVIHDAKQNQIFLYNIRTRKAVPYAIDNVSANQDYIWEPTLGILKSEGSKIYRYDTDNKVWIDLADFASYGIKKITRFTISTDGKSLALVSTN